MLFDLLLKLLGWVVRLGLMLAGLVFFVSLLAVALTVLLLWLLRALWARLTGQPVSPWTFKVNRQAVWQRFYGASDRAQQRGRAQTDVVDVDATDVTVVTDVEPKCLQSPQDKD